jgi:hypothetical protein
MSALLRSRGGVGVGPLGVGVGVNVGLGIVINVAAARDPGLLKFFTEIYDTGIASMRKKSNPNFKSFAGGVFEVFFGSTKCASIGVGTC